MQFLILGHDGTDDGAPARRQAVRGDHIARGERMKAEGSYLFGAALLDEAGQMIGSVMAMEFASRAELDAWLAVEPYVVGKVWQRIEIGPCRVGPTFEKKEAH